METKVCHVCGDEKELSCYAVSPKNTGGREHRCKECRAKRRRDHRRKAGIVYYNSRFDAYTYDGYAMGKCEVCDAEYPKIGKEHIRCSDCKVLVQNIHQHLRSLRKKGDKYIAIEKPATSQEAVEVAKRYLKYENCAYCGGTYSDDNPKTLDHIVPTCMGGSNSPHNIAICCEECNKSKCHLPLNRWVALCRSVSAREAEIRELANEPERYRVG